jgi:RNase H-like domain found in reverse transcriptase
MARSVISIWAPRVGCEQAFRRLRSLWILCRCYNHRSSAKVSETKRATANVTVPSELGSLWGVEHQAAFIDMQNQFRNLAIMAYQNPEKANFVFADASDEFYGGMITQTDKADLELPVDQQRHEPLAFCLGAFKGAQQRWGTPEREGFALIQVVVTVDYLI